MTPQPCRFFSFLFYGWLRERERWPKSCHEWTKLHYLARLGLPAFFRNKSVYFPYNKSFIDKACLVKMANRILASFYSLACAATRKKIDQYSIEPSWAHTWSITHIIIWLAPRAGKMNQIARCDWLPERARWSHLARSGLPAVSHKKNSPKAI